MGEEVKAAIEGLLRALRNAEAHAAHETLADRVRRLRIRAGLSQEALAEKADLSTMAVVQIETGRRKNPRITTAIALADALEVSLSELAGEK